MPVRPFVHSSIRPACLGVGAICEFGREKPEVTEITEASNRLLTYALKERLVEAQAKGEIAGDIDRQDAAGFLVANLVAIKLAARAGPDARNFSRLRRWPFGV